METAELESYRKEVNRPIYHIHKWWAQRLGSVFRAILIASNESQNSNIMKLFYSPYRMSDKTVYDPFMGSGTTIGEALKLGARAIGRDINPISYLIVKNALGRFSEEEIQSLYREIESDVAKKIKQFYKTKDGSDVLYYFWVKYVQCPNCSSDIELFSSRIFAKNAYPQKKPMSTSICPKCKEVERIRYDSKNIHCNICHTSYNPQVGNIDGNFVTCEKCRSKNKLIDIIRKSGVPPKHRLYAKLILNKKGEREYQKIEPFDLELYQKAVVQHLKDTVSYAPNVEILPGNNTNQILKYSYHYWAEMFNERQLLCHTILARRITEIKQQPLKELFAILFSGCLEFNNMFASYKGEGTGAVRHLFSHHIFKPERMPIEANIWGTPDSSGSFSTLFNSRIVRALKYKQNPFEIVATKSGSKLQGKKVFDLSAPLMFENASSFNDFSHSKMPMYISCGDSAKTDIAKETVDIIVTDPPFFDNVHYSELADFFYVWLKQIVNEEAAFQISSTRTKNEVQSENFNVFSENLSLVFTDCYRVLKPHGLLVFTFHHSNVAGWKAVAQAIKKSRFELVAIQPTKAELASAQPKRQANEPIDLDIILVCRKNVEKQETTNKSLGGYIQRSKLKVSRFNQVGKKLGRNDIQSILFAELLLDLISNNDSEMIDAKINQFEEQISASVQDIYRSQSS